MNTWNKYPDTQPPRNGWYIVCLTAGNIVEPMMFANGKWQTSSGLPKGVSYWMELPSPPSS
jgi:hypothetical protein